MSHYGINLRGTAGFVTDLAGETYSLGAAYPTVRGGLTFGWSADTTPDQRDRSSTDSPPHVSGTAYVLNTAPKSFRIDLPAVGAYNLRLALGDYTAARSNRIQLQDNGVTFATINVDNEQGQFTDAVGNSYYASSWDGANTAISHTFTSTNFTILLGDGTSGGYSGIASVLFDTAPGATTTIAALVGNASAVSPNATITQSGSTTITCAVGAGAAACPIAAVATKVMTDFIINNTGTRRTNQAVNYSWFPGGRIGAFTGITAQEGTGTTDANGRFVPGVNRATGLLLTCVRNADATADDVYYEAFA